MCTQSVENGVTIDVVSVDSDACDLENLGTLADKSGGTITRVKAAELASNFAGILANPILASKVSCRRILRAPKCLRLRSDFDAKAVLCDDYKYVSGELDNFWVGNSSFASCAIGPAARLYRWIRPFEHMYGSCGCCQGEHRHSKMFSIIIIVDLVLSIVIVIV